MIGVEQDHHRHVRAPASAACSQRWEPWGWRVLLAVTVAVARAARDARAHHPSVHLWAGTPAGLVALVVGRALDFLWHLPAVSLVAALLVGITVPKAKEKKQL